MLHCEGGFEIQLYIGSSSPLCLLGFHHLVQHGAVDVLVVRGSLEALLHEVDEGCTIARRALVHNVFLQHFDDPNRIGVIDEELDGREIVGLFELDFPDALFLVDIHLALEHHIVEVILDPLVREVDEHLLKAVHGHVFESKDVQHPDARHVTIDSFTTSHILVQPIDDHVENTRVDCLGNRIALSGSGFLVYWRNCAILSNAHFFCGDGR
mmetsp:Transcript_50774/g.107732  ORF Transcript_50774/g.107732 Transcript_50774/m.107732 type:complete len:211 (+) Transcript_50774:3650-4282(+)